MATASSAAVAAADTVINKRGGKKINFEGYKKEKRCDGNLGGQSYYQSIILRLITVIRAATAAPAAAGVAVDVVKHFLTVLNFCCCFYVLGLIIFFFTFCGKFCI